MNNVYMDLFEPAIHLLQSLLYILMPLFMGLTLAYLLHPVSEWFLRYMKKGPAILATYLGAGTFVVGILYGFLILILGAFPSGGWEATFISVTEYFQDAYNALTRTLEQWFPKRFPESEEITGMILQWFSSKFSVSTFINAAAKFSGLMFRVFLSIVISIYLLKDKDFFLRILNRLLSLTLKQKHHGILCEVGTEIDQVITSFLKAILIDSLLVGLLSSAALTLLGIDFSVIIGGIGGILNIIPYFGPFFSMVPAFLLAFFTEGISTAISVVVALFLVQQIDSNFLYPRIVGSSTGLHPLFVLLAVTFFGSLWGIPGMLLAVPTAGVIQVLIKQWVIRK